MCHTDLHYREGAINDEFPFLLGHEAAGVVESVGPDVTEVAPGDFVVLNWRAVCGTCRACRRGRPWYCFATFNATQKMTLTDGTELSPALGIGAFAEQTLVAAGQATKVDRGRQPRDRRPARLRRDGRARRRHVHRRRRTRRQRRGVRLRRRGQRRHRGLASRRRQPDHRRRHRPDEARSGREEFGATHTVDSRDDRSGRGHPCAHRRQRRRRVHRGGRPARGAASRPSTPATSRARSCRSACPTRPMTIELPDDRVLRPGRRAEAVVVRRLPPVARLPDAHRPLPLRAGSISTAS